MKANRLFYALGIGCTLCACSTTDEPRPQDDPNFDGSNKYVSISIVTPSDATKAASDFEDGDSKEYDVNGVGFFFYDRLGNCIDTEYVTESEFKASTSNENPAVTVMGTVEVELTANRVYDNVIAVLNPNSDLFFGSDQKELKKLSKEQILAYNASYSGTKTSGTKGNFTMSNTVYVDDDSYNGAASHTSYVAVPITSHNIYTKEKATDKLTDAEIADKAINIYVERVCAKISVPTAPTFTSYFVDEKGEHQTISVMTRTGEEKEITVKAVLKGMGLSVTSKNANLLKNIDGLTYKFNDDITNFQWNDINNKRTYWENTLGEKAANQGGGYNYTAWKDITNTTGLTAYVNPNTVDATSFDSNDADKTTKFLVCAQLKYTVSGSTDEKPLDLVKFSNGYWMADYLLFHAATRSFENLANLDYSTIAADKQAAAKTAVEKITAATIESQIELTRKTTDMAQAYLAQLSIKKNADFFADMTDEALKTKLAALVNANIKATLDEITSRQIQYWKDGMTYFYVPIRHEGFSGLMNGKYLNGVVRNHVYKLNITKIWGLGTLVINSDDPIDPERPDDAPDSYMTAQIHVLKWRVVNSDVVLH